MEAGRGGSLTPRGGRTGKGVKAAKGGARAQDVSPIYKRLPHGPHQLGRSEVILHQRRRIHGAMIEAVAQSSYERTSVKQVIGLAGVSRRSFYELFANKEECFLATFDLIAQREIQRVTRAYLLADGGIEQRLGAAFAKLIERSMEARKATLLVLVEAQTAGAGGTLHLRRATSMCEQLLAKSFADAPDASALPAPIVRGITGGLQGVIAARLGPTPSVRDKGLADALLGWTLLFQTPAAEVLAERMTGRLTRRMREISVASAHHRAPAATQTGGDERARLLDNALRLAALHDYRELTAPQIADEARVPIDSFLELFADKDNCFLAGLDMIGEEMAAIAGGHRTGGEDWPSTVRASVCDLMSYLAERPLYARTIAQEAFFAGTDAIDRNLEISRRVAELLSAGAPVPASCEVALEAIAGAFLHVVRCQVAAGRVQLLGALSDYFSYIVLAPFIGADAAVAALS